MDNVVSMKGSDANANNSFAQLAKEMRTEDLFLRGLSTHILMIGTLTGLQWWIYGAWKNLSGLGTSKVAVE
jgi:solute carrier family 25 (mitochondrial phosphate transporter), member 3